jgi:phage terminase large subunit
MMAKLNLNLSRLAQSLEKQLVERMDAGEAIGGKYPLEIQRTIEILDECGWDHSQAEAVRDRKGKWDLYLDYEETNPDIARLRAEELDRCKDLLYFVSNWLWTMDPREFPSNIPFRLWDRQREYLLWRVDRRNNQENGAVLKCRDAGVTWLNCADQLHCFLFRRDYQGAFGSRKVDLVHNLGDMNSIMEKIIFMMRTLPGWILKPKDYTTSLLKIRHMYNGAAIFGEGGKGQGRGGRATVRDMDEAAHLEQAKSIEAAISQNSRVIIYTSTPCGVGNIFAQKVLGNSIPVFRFRWHDDPRKTQEWYENEKKRLDPVIFAQEVEGDIHASIEGVIIPYKYIQSSLNLELPDQSGEYPLIGGFDIADEGANESVLILWQCPFVTDIEAWETGTASQTAAKGKDLAERKAADYVNYDCLGVGAVVGGNWGMLDEQPLFEYNAIDSSNPASDTEFYPELNKYANKIFKNLRAQMWWNLRQRFRKTYEYVNKIADYPTDELISIPDRPEFQKLISQLTMPLWKYSENGMLVVESKEDMKRRGVPSPDHADALVYALAPREDYSFLGY